MTNKIKVLAVDDDKTARMLYRAIGNRYDFDVVVVDDSIQALAALKTAKFDVVLMDWRLPEIDGMECTRMIREREKQEGTYIPVIAVTAYAMIGDREECLAAGADDYVSKPFNMVELSETIKRWAKRVVRPYQKEQTG